MKIHNIRMGHATNSSSSHSIIVMERPPADEAPESDEFGWENFTLASRGSKVPYLARILYSALNLPHRMAVAIVRDTLGYSPSEEGYIDHDSLWSLPKASDGHVHMGFAKELFDHILREGVVILGGNDNGDCHPLTSAGCGFDGGRFRGGSFHSCITRKDEQGFWTLFNKSSGAKLRLSFGGETGRITASPTHSTVPELVDLKITDYCAKGCRFCYQGSSRVGKHADKGTMETILYELGFRLGVLEVAIGGGEPLEHPEFDSIIETAARDGITPNVTTRRPLELAKRSRIVLDKIGAVGVSVGDDWLADIESAVILRRAMGGGQDRLVLHAILGVDPLDQIVKTATALHMPVLILGFKGVGRGASYGGCAADTGKSLAAAIQSAWGVGCARIGIDTCVAAKHKDVLDSLEIAPTLYDTQEGRFSMYVDAVEMFAAPSSYCDPSQRVSISAGAVPGRSHNYKYDAIGAAFKSFSEAP